MITLVLLATAVSLFAILLIAQVLVERLVYRKFKKDAEGLPVLPLGWLPGGHIHKLVLNSTNLLIQEPLHRRYGKTFGYLYNTRRIVYSIDLELIKTINLTESNKHVNRLNLSLPIKEFESDSIAFTYDNQWRRIRRAIAPSFTKHRVMSHNVVEEINSTIKNLIEGLNLRLDKINSEDSEIGIELNADDIMLRYSTDLIVSCFYKQYQLIDYSAKEDRCSAQVKRGLDASLHPITRLSTSMPLLSPIVQWLAENFHEAGKLGGVLFNFIRAQTSLNLAARLEIAQAKEKGVGLNPDNLTLADGRVFKRNMIDAFIDNYHEGKITKNEYLNSSFFLFLAGSKTVADALSRTLYYLAINQNVQKKLRDSLITDGTESEYLSWCIYEVLRLEPPVPVGGSRRVERDIVVEGGVVPRGTFVSTPSYVIHRLPEYWGEESHLFKPERWANKKEFHPAQYMPFGMGPRGCVGKEFAMFAMRKVIHSLLIRYKFERCNKTSDSPLLMAPFFVYVKRWAPTFVRMSKLDKQID